jgi:hypothetical protein
MTQVKGSPEYFGIGGGQILTQSEPSDYALATIAGVLDHSDPENAVAEEKPATSGGVNAKISGQSELSDCAMAVSASLPDHRDHILNGPILHWQPSPASSIIQDQIVSLKRQSSRWLQRWAPVDGTGTRFTSIDAVTSTGRVPNGSIPTCEPPPRVVLC